MTDLTAADDHINRDHSFSSIRRNPFPSSESTECIDMIEELPRSTKARTPVPKHSKPHLENLIWSTSSGAVQGRNESPNLYNVFPDYAVQAQVGTYHFHTLFQIN